MRLSRTTAIFLLLGLSIAAAAQELRVVLIETKTGRPLRGKGVCVSFSPDDHATGIDRPNVCNETNSKGSIPVVVPQPRVEVIHISVLTNGLLPCFAIPHAFPVAQIAETGMVVPNNCAAVSITRTPEPGVIALFAHQMTFWEKIRDAWGELF
jgi:hypothetical protein